MLDDAFEVTINPEQSLESLRGLFGLDAKSQLVRDFESPQDETIGESELVFFRDGPVFSVRASLAFAIIVNGRKREVAERRLTFDDLITLAYQSPPQGEFICWTITYRRGPCENPEGTLREGESVQLTNGMIFNVKWTDRS